MQSTETNYLPFRAPKHEKATIKAKIVPPTVPKRALPKSMATVLLKLTVALDTMIQGKSSEKIGWHTLSRTTKYERFAVRKRIYET